MHYAMPVTNLDPAIYILRKQYKAMGLATLEDLKMETKVTDAQLRLKCTVKHLKELAPSVGNYPKFASAFNLTGGDLSNIETDLKLSYTSKTEQVFLWWSKNTKSPTYLTFVKTCLNLKEGGLAREMCILCQDTKDKEPITSESACLSTSKFPVLSTQGLLQKTKLSTRHVCALLVVVSAILGLYVTGLPDWNTIKLIAEEKVISSSKVGRSALDVDTNEPTMVLNLYRMTKALQRSIVIHEFGHALGLYHEHQRSDFWDVLESKDKDNQYRFIIGIDQMKTGDGGNCNPAVDAVFRDDNAPLESQKSSYDPDSIMHYWFDTNWLLKKYRKRSSVAKHVEDERERKVLLGVHDRDYHNGQLAENPSKLDYETLNRAYEVISGQRLPITTVADGPPGISQKTKPEGSSIGSSSEEYSSKHPKVVETVKQSVVLNETDILTICEKLKSARKDWFDLGAAFGLKHSRLKDIEDLYPDNKRRLREMISKRLEGADSDNPVTWPYICECLRSPTVERKDVANQLVAIGLCG
ncbi:uncharacterized protein LOC135335603 isoform X4 [Halichondria panicea]|uniref:uncharacterized protein LOC135335603 isoform X4 n=1 Tax=Halichondria panicea TaxID=6063 RepID=UPI00312B3436